MMKRFTLFLTFFLFLFTVSLAQTIEFSDDFESGTAAWTLEGAWGLTTAQSNSPNNSLTDSPGGNYLANQNISATMNTGVDLSSALDANLNFWAIYDIEGGNFDFCYVEASANGGPWQNVATFLGQNNLSPWVEYSYSLGGYVGNTDVRIRFRFFSDGGFEVDGIYIDDVEITSSNTDNAPPLLLHTPNEHYESQLGDITKTYDIIDISGITSANLTYTVDGGPGVMVAGTNTSGDTYEFVIPAQSSGSQVDYFVEAVDGSANSNTAVGETHSYIDGNHIFYDDGTVSFVQNHGPGAASGLLGAAVRFTLTGEMDITYALIRNYTDINRPNDDIEVHVWADAGGGPGADLITPITISPEADLIENSPMTRIDLRPFSAELSGLSGDVFVGYTVPAGETWLVQTTPGIGGRTYNLGGGTWTNDTDDYHFRIVTTAPSFPVDYVFSVDMSNETVSPNGVHITGSFNNWDPAANPLMDVGNGIWTGVITLEANTLTEYKFLNGNDFSGEENVPMECGVDNGFGGYNRSLMTSDQNGIVDIVCFNTCLSACPTNVNLTFQVNMSDENISPNGVHVTGSFNGWDSSANPMTDSGNGIYTATVSVPSSSTYEYKFLNGNDFGGEENVPMECGVDNGYGGFNRVVSLTSEDMMLDVVCFGSCVDCVTNVNEIEGLEVFDVSPNPFSERIFIDIEFSKPEFIIIECYNAVGQKVFSKTPGTIVNHQEFLDGSGLASTMYFIRLVTQNGSKSVKLVKE